MPPHTQTILDHLRRLTSPTVSDAVLLSRWTEQRDEAAFTALVSRHGPMVLGVCRRVLGDVHMAEDAFQAVFLVLRARPEACVEPEALASFLYGVALRLARKAHGAATRRWRLGAKPLAASEPVDPHPHALDVLSGRELLALLDEEVARLPEVYRLPLLLCVLQGRTVEEAARTLGWSIGSLRGRLRAGRERLRERLTRRGLGLSVGTLVLLAPAVVSERLLAACVRNLAAPASAAVHALAASASAFKWKLVCLCLFVLTMVGLGAGLPLLRAPVAETPAAVPPAASPQAKDEPRRDRDGDPLPPRAITRLGTRRFLRLRRGSGAGVSPDGKTIAVASSAGRFLFDAASGKRTKHLPSPDDYAWPTNLLVFSPDGKRLAARMRVSVGDGTKEVMRVWEVAGGGKPKDYEAEHAVWVGWSANSEPLAVCLEKDGLRLHELAAGRSRHFACKDLPRPELNTNAHCAYSPAGQVLAITDEQLVVHIWNTATGRERCTLQPGGEYDQCLSLSPDGRTLLTITSKTAQLWDAATGKAKQVLTPTDRYGAAAAFSADGKTLATVDSAKPIHFWDVATGRELGHTQGHDWFVLSLAFSPDGKTLVTAERNLGVVHLWDVATGQRKPQAAGHRGRPHGTAFAPDGWRVATGGGLDGTIHVWDLESGESLTRIHRPNLWVRDIAFSPDGRSLFSTWTDDELWISGAVSGGRRDVIKLVDPDRPDTTQSAISMYRSGDGKMLVALSYYHPKKNNDQRQYRETLITGWDTSTRKQLFRRRRPGTDSWLAVSADARTLAAPHPRQQPTRDPAKGQCAWRTWQPANCY